MDLRAFTNRFEIKYLVRATRVDEIRSALAEFLVPDANNVNGRGYYNYSIYFDTPDFRFYHEKHEGQLARIKPRLRLYKAAIADEPTAAYVELKKRIGAVVKKERAAVTLEEARQLLEIGPTVDKRNHLTRDLPEFVYYQRRFGIVPCVTVLYHRLAYHSELYPQVRLTFDMGIRESLSNQIVASSSVFTYALPPNWMIVELKYNDTVPRLLLHRCRELGLRRWTFSKFGVCLEKAFGRFHDSNFGLRQAPLGELQ